MKKALANSNLSACVRQFRLRTVPKEEEVDYLNEKLDHDH